MRRKLVFIASVFMAANILYAQNTMPIDDAIRAAAGEIEAGLDQGIKVVVLNFRSPAQRFSDYVLDEMMTALVRNRKITVVDRVNLELIQQELDFQLSGEVSDSSAQAIGQKLGAQSIVSGNIEDMGTFYRVRFRVIEVESAAIQVLSSLNVQKDAQIAILMGSAIPGSQAGDSSNTVFSPTQYPRGLNFSTKRKVGAGFANWGFGAGSFAMGDWVGGLIVGTIELAGLPVFVYFLLRWVDVIPYDNPYVPGWEYKTADKEKYPTEEAWQADRDKNDAERRKYMVSFITGASIYGAGVIAGYIRPFKYDIALAKKQGTYISSEYANPMYHLTIEPVYHGGKSKIGLLYSTSY